MSHEDQQSSGTTLDLPCPWCGTTQDLSGIEIAEDSEVHCDECDNVYAIVAMRAQVQCPGCLEAATVTMDEVAENSVEVCARCHKAFRAGEVASVIQVTAERVG